MNSRESSVHGELGKCNDSCERCDACDECEQQTNHLSKSVFTQTTGKMLPWQPDSGGTSSFSVPVEMSHTNAARNGDIKWLVLCSTNFSLSSFISPCLVRSLSHLHTLRNKVLWLLQRDAIQKSYVEWLFQTILLIWFATAMSTISSNTHGRAIIVKHVSFSLTSIFNLKVYYCTCVFSFYKFLVCKDPMKSEILLVTFVHIC